VAGEIHRIRGFFEARRENENAAGVTNTLTPALSRREREKEPA
jgi:hypothetical protein